MSDKWDFYFCRMDDRPASIFVDLGIATELPKAKIASMAYIRLYLNSPRDDGLSGNEEFEALKAIEDSLDQGFTSGGSSVYVGRCTSNGCRDFYFYTSRPTEWANNVSRVLGPQSGHKFETGTRDDPEWSTYTGFLFPGPVDLERIKNRNLCATLEKNGDSLSTPREIDHWIYFSDAVARAAFIAGAIDLGFKVRGTSDPNSDNADFSVQLWRSDVPSFDGVDAITLPLYELAQRHSGRYDGWETPVVT